MAGSGFPNIAHIAKIDPAQYFRQNWRHAFYLELPTVLKAKYANSLLQTLSPQPSDFTVLVPYLQSKDTKRPAATFITPTLAGGKHVEDRGRISESKTISGMSGYMAAVKHQSNLFQRYVTQYQNAAGDIFDLQRGIFNPEGRLNEKGLRSGYAWFHRFANLFEIYWDIKRTQRPKLANATRLIWIDEKDDCYRVVVPLDFSFRQQAPRENFQYSWSITMETIEDASVMRDRLKSSSDADPANIFERISSAIDVAQQALTTITSLVDMAPRAIGALLRDVITPFSKLINFASNVASLPLTFIESVEDLLRSGITAGQNALGGIATLYGAQSAVERTFNEAWLGLVQAGEMIVAQAHTLSGTTRGNRSYPEVRNAEGVKYNGGRPYPRDTAATQTAYNQKSARGSDDINQAATLDTVGNSYTSSGSTGYDTRMHPSVKKGLQGYTESRQDWLGTRTTTVHSGDTIFDVARRELGDVQFWQDLVILNKLRYPYISSTNRKQGVLGVGDALLIPVPATEDSQSGPAKVPDMPPQLNGVATSGTTTTLVDITRQTLGLRWRNNQWEGYRCTILSGTNAGVTRRVQSNTQYSLAFDGANPWPVALDTTSAYLLWLDPLPFEIPSTTRAMAFGFDLKAQKVNGKYDMVLGDDLDAAVVTGIDALVQDLQMAFDTVQGGNAHLPLDGMPQMIGSKATTANILTFRIAARQVVLSDPRIDDIVRETVLLGDKADIVGVELIAQLKDGNQIPIGLRS